MSDARNAPDGMGLSPAMKNQPVDHTAAYFALAGALGAALLAIIGSELGAWRQRKAEAARLDRQLAAERERLELQLAAERERQAERLQK